VAELVDPLLPARLRNLSIVVAAEQRIQRSWFQSVVAWLDQIRQSVMTPFRDSQGVVLPQVAMMPDNHMWRDLVTRNVIPEVARSMEIPYGIIGGPDINFGSDAAVRNYLEQSTARMVNLPIEVYGMITRIVSGGLDNGDSVPDIAAHIQERLTAAGPDHFWPNRAITVARTEAIGATNAGAFFGALERARIEGDANPEKVWISTMDARTRESHRMADQQRVPLTQPFVVGGFSLMFPGDPSGPANEVINCRCSILDVVAGEDISWTNRQFMEGS